MMHSVLIASLLALQSAGAPPPANDAQLSQENRALLRCSAAFALVSHGQANGNEAALKWPQLETRGREFFVRSLAQLMDQTGLDRTGISALVSREAQRIVDSDEIEQIMPACLVMLRASGV